MPAVRSLFAETEMRLDDADNVVSMRTPVALFNLRTYGNSDSQLKASCVFNVYTFHMFHVSSCIKIIMIHNMDRSRKS